MEQGKAHEAPEGTAGPAGVTPTTPRVLADQTLRTLPTSVRDALRMMIVPGVGEACSTASTDGGPVALALALADLAARLSSLPLPVGYGLSAAIYFQPIVPAFMEGADREAAEEYVIDATAGTIMPSVQPGRQVYGNSVHYSATGRTPAGLGVGVFTSVEPTRAERAAAAEKAAERAWSGGARAVAEAAPAGEFVPVGTFDDAAEAAGHGIKIVKGGQFDAPGSVVAECACGDYRSGAGTEVKSRASWRRHAASRFVGGGSL